MVVIVPSLALTGLLLPHGAHECNTFFVYISPMAAHVAMTHVTGLGQLILDISSQLHFTGSLYTGV